MGVIFHGLPTRDPARCRLWLRAIQNPRFTEDTPACKYSGVRVCSLHFKPEDYEEDFRAKILNVAPKPSLKSGAVPSVFPGRECAEPGCGAASPPAPKRSKPQVSYSGAAAGSSQPLPPPSSVPDQTFSIVVSVDPLDDGVQSEPEVNSVSDESDEDVDKDCAVVYTRSLMELFRRCQTCGQLISQTQVLQTGAQVKVKWSCHGGHSGVWKSSHRLRAAVE